MLDVPPDRGVLDEAGARAIGRPGGRANRRPPRADADPPSSLLAVCAAGGAPTPARDGVTIGGWTVTSRKGAMAGAPGLDAARAALGGPPALPEQLFSDARLTATHAASGVTLSFCATGALRAWRAAARDAPRVPAAAAWRAARAKEIRDAGAPTLDYDWTFTAPYKGDLSGGGGSAPARFTPTPSRLDRAPLTARDPILYWDDVPLFASELDDCGAASAGVRVRVMPSCWFALARTFVRVDGVLVRLYECRVLASFDAACASAPPVVTREWRAVEGSLSDLAASGAPGGGPAYADADAAAAALAAVAPVGVVAFETEALVLG